MDNPGYERDLGDGHGEEVRKRSTSITDKQNGSEVRSRKSSRASTHIENETEKKPPRPPLKGQQSMEKTPPARADVFDDDDEDTETLDIKKQRIQMVKSVAVKCCKSCCGSLGLLVAVIGYSLLGGYLFYILEAQNEISGCQERKVQYIHSEAETVNRLLDIAEQNSPTMNVSFQKLLSNFRDTVYKVDYDGTDCDKIGKTGGPEQQWSLSGSTMFAVTITTTVGYGHISPKTFWGKMVCIAYAVLGIPIMLLFLANIGDVLADFFKFFYTKICCLGCCRAASRQVEEVPEENTWNTEKSGEPKPPMQAGPVVIDDDEDDYDFDDDNVTIPLTVTLGIIAGYIMFGSVLFDIWEKEWSASDAAYFCFVTLSTIGFGDFVPGQNDFDKPETKINVMMGAVYIVFGMAILSMCFSLIQDEIAAKFKWLGTKLGLVGKTEDETNEQEVS